MTLDRVLHRLGEALRDEQSRQAFLRRLQLWIRRTLLALNALFFLGIFGTVFLMHVIGEKNVTLAFLLYLPRQGFLLPLPLLFIATLLFHWRLALAQIPLALLFVKFGMSWQSPPQSSVVLEPPESRPPGTLTVLSYNRGQHLNQSLQPFKNLTRPDVIVLQESAHRAARYAKAPDYSDLPHVSGEGEFTLISRYPILSVTPFNITREDGGMEIPVSRFEIDFNGQRIAIFSAHAVSPRDALLYFRRGAFLQGILGLPGTPWNEKRKHSQQFWDNRIKAVEKLLEVVENEPLPYLVVGDFNAPAGGFIHRLLAGRLNDAHLASGHGFGYTFPGRTRNPLSRGGPWMRIDYIFSSPDWKTLQTITEKHRTSQHRALTAAIQLEPVPRLDEQRPASLPPIKTE